MEGGEGGLVDRGIEGELQLLVMALALYFRSLITEYNKTVSAGDSQWRVASHGSPHAYSGEGQLILYFGLYRNAYPF